MNVSELPKPVLFNLLLQIEPEEIITVCKSKNPKIREICYLPRFMKEYENKYKIEKVIKLQGFLPPIILDTKIKNFLLNADFKNFNSEIHEVIDPLLNINIFNIAGLISLFIIYMKLHNLMIKDGYKLFYTIDEEMNKYLDPYFTELERNNVNFYRYRFPYNKMHSVIRKGIIKPTEFSIYDKIALNIKKIQVSEAYENIKKISDKLRI